MYTRWPTWNLIARVSCEAHREHPPSNLRHTRAKGADLTRAFGPNGLHAALGERRSHQVVVESLSAGEKNEKSIDSSPPG